MFEAHCWIVAFPDAAAEESAQRRGKRLPVRLTVPGECGMSVDVDPNPQDLGFLHRCVSPLGGGSAPAPLATICALIQLAGKGPSIGATLVTRRESHHDVHSLKCGPSQPHSTCGRRLRPNSRTAHPSASENGQAGAAIEFDSGVVIRPETANSSTVDHHQFGRRANPDLVVIIDCADRAC